MRINIRRRTRILPILLSFPLGVFPLAVFAQATEFAAGGAESATLSDTTEAPGYPHGLDDTPITLEELRLRLLPLTIDQLSPLAQAWRDNAQAITQQLVDLTLRVEEAGPETVDGLSQQRAALIEERKELFEKYGVVLSSLEAKGGDPDLIKQLRTYRVAIMVEEAGNLTPAEITKNVFDWLVSVDGGLQLAVRIAVIVASFMGLLIAARIVRGWARRGFGRIHNLSKLLRAFLAMAAYWLTIAAGLMIVLAALGVNVTPLFALVGGASFIIAFALQDTLGNLAAGLMIIINRPFDEGDYVTIAGRGGTVCKVSVVSTTISTPDNQIIIIPNSKVWGDVITNVTASNTRRVDMVFRIGYEDSIERVQDLLEEIVAAHPKVLKDPEPMIRVNELGESSVNFIVRPWVSAKDYWDVYWELTQTVKDRFDKQGITIPFPRTEIHIRGGPEGNLSHLKPT